MVECNLAKVDVEGSNPFSRSAGARFERIGRFDFRTHSLMCTRHPLLMQFLCA